MAGVKISREQVAAAMARLPEEDHRLLLWLCTGQIPQPEPVRNGR